MSFLRQLFKEEPKPATDAGSPADPQWRRPANGGYYQRLLSINLDLEALRGVGGVYVIWHRGVRPGWVHVAATDDLGRALSECRDHPAILGYEMRGGLYVTWSTVLPDFRAGVVTYLRQAMAPEIEESLPWDDTLRKAEPMPVKFPT